MNKLLSLRGVLRLRRLSAWLVSLYLARMYVEHGWIKFDPEGFWTDAFERWGFPVWFRWLVGVAEVSGGVLVVIPWVASYGALMLVAVMTGAAVVRLGGSRYVDVAWILGYTLALSWIAYEWWPLRRPRWGGAALPAAGSISSAGPGNAP